MKRLLFSLFFLILTTSCITRLQTVTPEFYDIYDDGSFHGYQYKQCELKIPKGYQEWIILGDCDCGSCYIQHCYYYFDSTLALYISQNGCLNSNNIKHLGDSIYEFRFQYKALWEDINRAFGEEVMKIIPDTLELSGIDADSLYWKDIYIDGISIGYLKVPKEKKELYDKCLRTFKMEKRIEDRSNRKSP